MKKLLKLSTTALIIAGANMLFSQPALACTQNDPHYDACVYHNIILPQQQQQQGYGNYGGGGNSRYQVDFLSLMWTNSGEPYFYKEFYIVSGGFDYESAENDALNKCNRSASRRPCRLASSATGKSCIAIAGGESKYSFAGNTCDEAKDEALNYCQARDGNPYACKIIQTKKP